MSALITLEFVVPAGYQQGDYAKLHSNGGSGEINWDTPLTKETYELFPNGGGIFGWGFAPWGHFRWGHAHSMRVIGWGHLPWGRFPWGHGTAVIAVTYSVQACGDYEFGFACYDSIGNLHEGTPGEATAIIHIAPPAPTGLVKNSYNKVTDILILDAA